MKIFVNEKSKTDAFQLKYQMDKNTIACRMNRLSNQKHAKMPLQMPLSSISLFGAVSSLSFFSDFFFKEKPAVSINLQ